IACPIVREPDGLAMSSRNVYLDAAAREQAVSLSRALAAASAVHAGGERDATRIMDAARGVLVAAGVTPEYVELRDAATLEPLRRVDRDALLALAAHVGAARLIDNQVLKGDA